MVLSLSGEAGEGLGSVKRPQTIVVALKNVSGKGVSQSERVSKLGQKKSGIEKRGVQHSIRRSSESRRLTSQHWEDGAYKAKATKGPL